MIFTIPAASAVVMAKEYGAGLKVIWREEEGCGDACGNPGFNSSWLDLFSEPKLRLADNFPGMSHPILTEVCGHCRSQEAVRHNTVLFCLDASPLVSASPPSSIADRVHVWR